MLSDAQKHGPKSATVLFLCTGNYYRSRFAEYYFRHLTRQRGLNWLADSRGLALHPANTGFMSLYTKRECEKRGVCCLPDRFPLTVTQGDLESAAHVVAVKETEHRPMIRAAFPEWEMRIEYWEVHDLDVHGPELAFPALAEHVEALLNRLTR